MGHLSSLLLQWVQSGGYIGVFVAMALESACIPLPSEIVMPFGGYLAWAGHLYLWIVILMGTLGNVAGSLIAYYVGKFAGRAVILRYGRYVRLSDKRLLSAEKRFEHRGEWAVFIGRLLPGIRTFISLPAGIANMNVFKFTLYSAVGSLPWVGILAYAGYKLGQDWESVKNYTHPLIYVAALLIAAFVVVLFVKSRRKAVEGGN